MSVTSKVREQEWSKTKLATATEETGFGEMVKWEAIEGSVMLFQSGSYVRKSPLLYNNPITSFPVAVLRQVSAQLKLNIISGQSSYKVKKSFSGPAL